MKRRRWKIILALVVGLLIFAGVWAAMVTTSRQYDVDAYRKSLEAQGEKFEVADFLPASVPANQNGADLITEATSLLAPDIVDVTNTPIAMRMIAPGKAIVCSRQPFALSRDTSNSWENAMSAVAYDHPATELLRQVINLPALDFHWNYTDPGELRLDPLLSLRRCATRLSAETVCDLHNGDTAAAVTNLCALLALVHGQQEDRVAYSQIIRASIAVVASDASWELLQATNVNDTQLALLQQQWQHIDYVRPLENSILMGRAMAEASIAKMRTSTEYFNRTANIPARSAISGLSGSWVNDLTGLADDLRRTYGGWMWRVSWTYTDELRLLKNDQLILQTVRVAETNGCFDPGYTNLVTRFQGFSTNDTDAWADFQWMFSRVGDSTVNIVGRIIAAEADRQMAIAAIALKRYQLRHGNYPADLDSLVPEFLAAIPHDPMDGRPLRYRPNPDGSYLLYSIGADGKDDGGNPGTMSGRSMNFYNWLTPRAQDWVWPQPASPAEVESFYASLPR